MFGWIVGGVGVDSPIPDVRECLLGVDTGLTVDSETPLQKSAQCDIQPREIAGLKLTFP